MFAKKTLITLSAGALLAAAVPAFAQQPYWGDDYRSRDRVAQRYGGGLTFEQWAARTPSPWGMSWAQKLHDDQNGAEFGDGERDRLKQAQALYQQYRDYGYSYSYPPYRSHRR